MINALYEPFPEIITADGIEYPVVTDFREWFRFADMMNDKELSPDEKIILMTEWLIEVPEKITNDLVYSLFGFYHAKELEPEPPQSEDDDDEPEQTVKPPVVDWKIDSKFIIGDFRRYYGINLLSVEYMHWWEFRCLFSALPDDSQMMKRIAYRSADLSKIRDKAERNRIMKIQQAIRIPFEYDEDMIGAAFGSL